MALSKTGNKAKQVISAFVAEEVEEVAMGASAAAMQLIFDSLINLYADPLWATLREVFSNAYDATKLMPQDERRPVELTLPTLLNPTLVIRDYGVGMDRDIIRKNFAQYSASSKRESFEEIGAHGFGAKSPLAYCEEFSGVSVRDGQSITFTVGRGANNNVTRIFPAVPTQEPSGTTITIPVNHKDIPHLEKGLRNFIPETMDVPLLVDGEPWRGALRNEDTPPSYIYLGDVLLEQESGTRGRIWIKETSILNLINAYGDVVFTMGGWRYASPNPTYRYGGRDDSFLVELKPGVVNFSSSRDEITVDERFKTLSSSLYDQITQRKDEFLRTAAQHMNLSQYLSLCARRQADVKQVVCSTGFGYSKFLDNHPADIMLAKMELTVSPMSDRVSMAMFTGAESDFRASVERVSEAGEFLEGRHEKRQVNSLSESVLRELSDRLNRLQGGHLRGAALAGLSDRLRLIFVKSVDGEHLSRFNQGPAKVFKAFADEVQERSDQLYYFVQEGPPRELLVLLDNLGVSHATVEAEKLVEASRKRPQAAAAGGDKPAHRGYEFMLVDAFSREKLGRRDGYATYASKLGYHTLTWPELRDAEDSYLILGPTRDACESALRALLVKGLTPRDAKVYFSIEPSSQLKSNLSSALKQTPQRTFVAPGLGNSKPVKALEELQGGTLSEEYTPSDLESLTPQEGEDLVLTSLNVPGSLAEALLRLHTLSGDGHEASWEALAAMVHREQELGAHYSHRGYTLKFVEKLQELPEERRSFLGGTEAVERMALLARAYNRLQERCDTVGDWRYGTDGSPRHDDDADMVLLGLALESDATIDTMNEKLKAGLQELTQKLLQDTEGAQGSL